MCANAWNETPYPQVILSKGLRGQLSFTPAAESMPFQFGIPSGNRKDGLRRLLFSLLLFYQAGWFHYANFFWKFILMQVSELRPKPHVRGLDNIWTVWGDPLG